MIREKRLLRSREVSLDLEYLCVSNLLKTSNEDVQ